MVIDVNLTLFLRSFTRIPYKLRVPLNFHERKRKNKTVQIDNGRTLLLRRISLRNVVCYSRQHEAHEKTSSLTLRYSESVPVSTRGGDPVS